MQENKQLPKDESTDAFPAYHKPNFKAIASTMKTGRAILSQYASLKANLLVESNQKAYTDQEKSQSISEARFRAILKGINNTVGGTYSFVNVLRIDKETGMARQWSCSVYITGGPSVHVASSLDLKNHPVKKISEAKSAIGAFLTSLSLPQFLLIWDAFFLECGEFIDAKTGHPTLPPSTPKKADWGKESEDEEAVLRNTTLLKILARQEQVDNTKLISPLQSFNAQGIKFAVKASSLVGSLGYTVFLRTGWGARETSSGHTIMAVDVKKTYKSEDWPALNKEMSKHLFRQDLRLDKELNKMAHQLLSAAIARSEEVKKEIQSKAVSEKVKEERSSGVKKGEANKIAKQKDKKKGGNGARGGQQIQRDKKLNAANPKS